MILPNHDVRLRWSALLALVLTAATATPAQAVDACKVLLCLAGSWRSIPACVPEVRKVLRDMARGKVFPTCKMAQAPSGLGVTSTPGGYTGVSDRMLQGTNCPHYFRLWSWLKDESQVSPDGKPMGSWSMDCEYSSVAELTINGLAWKRTYANQYEALEEWQPAAREALGLGFEPIEADIRRAQWVAAGSPKGPPATPANFVDANPGLYIGCVGTPYETEAGFLGRVCQLYVIDR
jgi:hypothetical protein